MLDRPLFRRAISQACQQGPDLTDDLGVIGAKRDMCFRMLGLQLNGAIEGRLNLAADPLRERLRDRYLLGVTPKSLGMKVKRVGKIGRYRLQSLGASSRLKQDLAFPAAVRLQIG